MEIATLFQQVLFYVFAGAMVLLATMVIISSNPVRSALFLVAAFFAGAGIWLLLEAEFLALILVLVYVGAVMTLFLFVVMTLNVDLESKNSKIRFYAPFGLLVVAVLTALVIHTIAPNHFSAAALPNLTHPAGYSNLKALGMLLYTDYAYSFELAAILLLVAIVAAIGLSLRPDRKRKVQRPELQVMVRREDRIRIVKVEK